MKTAGVEEEESEVRTSYTRLQEVGVLPFLS